MSFKEAPTAHCPTCGAMTTRLPDGACTVCSARAAGKQERARREAAQKRERDRLGCAPLGRSLAIARYGLEASGERLTVAIRYAASDAQERQIERALRLVTEAREALQ